MANASRPNLPNDDILGVARPLRRSTSMTLRARLRFASWIVVASCASWTTARAQSSSARRWLARGALVVVAASLDATVRDAMARNQGAGADRVANLLEPLG